ncbi:hypothetical protein QTP70_031702 [Hemibagrus guttatus]|uniref:Reverse transcriptase domain-containing protein n=1 Tax=Hemibagrus guttatus TaxID=175788 RepID=A0AAE0QFF6_9TELE|nr:hypothetical protein QTP70_031702 [Hemibagrus guttatus]
MLILDRVLCELAAVQEVEEDFVRNLPKITEESARELDRELTLEELEVALNSMQNGHSPGIDGLLVEFFKAFWSVIGQDLLEVLRASINEGRLPLSSHRAVLTLLPKKGDQTDIRNWCPVSLLCTDCKVLSRALATRLGKVMEQVIHFDQTYCVPGRSIHDNVHLIRDILDVSRLLDWPVLTPSKTTSRPAGHVCGLLLGQAALLLLGQAAPQSILYLPKEESG